MTMPTTDFNVPRGSFPTPIAPIGVGPLEGPLVEVRFNYKWCQVVVGSLSQLLLNTTWDVNSQAALTAIQEDVFDLMAAFCVNPPAAGSTPQAGSDGDELMIRQNPTNPCILESSVDGTNWCQWADLSKCIPQVTQPGSGSSQPKPGGGCTSYHANLDATGAWLLPAPVNTGDVINVTNAKGAWNDGTVNPWQCPDGFNYFAGLCVGSTYTQSGDPVPTSPHMSLIGHIIGGPYFPVLGGSVTIPSGVVFGQLEFICNDSIRSDNLGSIEFDVQACNNQAATWAHDLDFRLSTQGFSTTGVVNAGGTWVAGVGWQNTDVAVAGGPNHSRNVDVERTVTAHLTNIKLTGTWTLGHYDVITGAKGLQIYDQSANQINLNASAMTNGTQTWDSGPIAVDVTKMGIFLQSDFGVNAGLFTGTDILISLHVEGSGPDPF